MSPLDDLEGDCCEEELSEVQVEFYQKALKEHEEALDEAHSIKKEGSTVLKQGNIWTVKSTYQVKLQNAATIPNLVMSQAKTSAPTSIAIQANTTSGPISTAITRTQPLLTAPQPAIPATGVIRTITTQVGLPVRSAQPTIATQPTTLVTYANKKNVQDLVPLQSKSQVVLTTPQVNVTKPMKVGQSVPQTAPPSPPQPAPQSPPPSVPLKQPAAVQITKSIQAAQPTQTAQQRKTTLSEGSTDDPKQAVKGMPSLAVVVKPSKTLPEIICQKKREALDGFVKSRLVLDPRKFAEWLMQAGLIRNKQTGICRFHSPNISVPLQLRMYEDTTKFPNSGGYVWMTKCCDKTFVSIFRDSIFEDSPHPPTVLLKLIYHWACQTSVNNVVQWVKVDHYYIRSFYAMLRSACTVELHSSTPVFGLSTINNRVEVGVISLGTTSNDGKRRDVKVEVLGVYDQESRKFRLRASEPVAGETAKGKARFTRILEPLQKWVSKNAMILTDQTVDRSSLNDLGFDNVSQKSLSNSTLDDPMTNRTVMDYMRKVVPKVFQSSLSALNTATIQQFLDELLWRESHGQSHSDAFHSMMRDLSTQSRAETGLTLIRRLTVIGGNPFKDWGLTTKQPPSLLVDPQPHVSSILTGTKRPAPVLKDASHVAGPSVPKEQRISSYYATMQDLRKEFHDDPRDAEIFCQIPGCKKITKSNIDMMDHMRNHLMKETAFHQSNLTEHCHYCLTSFLDAEHRVEHESKYHTFITSFTIGMGKEDSAIIRDVVCLICHDKFPAYRDLEQHLEKSHVFYEMPYRCRVCFFHSSSHSLLIDHFRDAHKISTQLLCPLCLEVFSIKGDNLANSPDVGHLKYLDHLKTHIKAPPESRPRCKKCALAYIEHDKLVSHWKCEHLTFSNSIVARPFTFTIVKPLTSAVVPQVPIAQNQIGKHETATVTPPVVTAIPEETTTAVVSATTTNNGTPTTVTATAAAVSPAATTITATTATAAILSPVVPSVSASKTIKTYTKEPMQEIPNMTVTKRYNISVCEDSPTGSYLCIECKDPLRKKNHFSAYICCMLCRFSTCCAVAMRTHQNQAHKPPLTPLLGSVFALDREVRCKCGFTAQGGIEIERHMKRCGTSSVTILL